MPTRTLLAIALAGWMAGCTTRVADLALVAPRELKLEPHVIVRGIQGIDCARSVLFVPLGRRQPSMQTALARALAKVPGADALTDVRIDRATLFTLFFNRSCLQVRADAVVLP